MGKAQARTGATAPGPVSGALVLGQAMTKGVLASLAAIVLGRRSAVSRVLPCTDLVDHRIMRNARSRVPSFARRVVNAQEETIGYFLQTSHPIRTIITHAGGRVRRVRSAHYSHLSRPERLDW